MYHRNVTPIAWLLAGLGALLLALGARPAAGWPVAPQELPVPRTQTTPGFGPWALISNPATTTLYVPLLLRNWQAPYPKLVWGTQFGPHQEEHEPLYTQLVEHELPLVKAAGFTSIRPHLSWREVEPENATPDSYDWSKYDRRLQDFKQFGLDPMISIVDYPAWATRYYCGGGLLPGMEAEWREFVRAVTQRYSAPPYDVHLWEIGNEVDGETEVDPDEDNGRPPEQGGGQPTWPFGGCWGDMAPEYVAFLRAAYEEIKAVDPTATVMMGGLAYAEFERWFIREFFDDFLAAGGGAYTDVINFHWFPYRQPWATAGEKAAELRDMAAAHGVYHKPLWLTETYMWDRDGDTQTRDLRFTFITQELPRALGSGAVERVYWFGFWDFDPAITTFDRGLTTVDHQPKPGLKVFEIMADFVKGEPQPPLGVPGGIEAYRFLQPESDQETWALWSTTGQTETITLRVSGSQLKVTEIQAGDTYTSTHAITTTFTIEDGQIILDVGPRTRFLRVEK
jgi:hypothetical protein